MLFKYLKIAASYILNSLGLIFLSMMVYTTTQPPACGNKIIRTKITLDKLDQAIEEFYLDTRNYPHSLSDLTTDNHENYWMGPYVKPEDIIDPWGEAYFYNYFPERNSYQLFTLGKDKKERGDDSAMDRLSNNSIQFIVEP